MDTDKIVRLKAALAGRPLMDVLLSSSLPINLTREESNALITYTQDRDGHLLEIAEAERQFLSHFANMEHERAAGDLDTIIRHFHNISILEKVFTPGSHQRISASIATKTGLLQARGIISKRSDKLI
ncbi:MAG: hypothetical protein ABIH34_02965 [Nanoarchaeota archaeon]